MSGETTTILREQVDRGTRAYVSIRNNCIVLSQQDIEAASILDLGSMSVGEAAEERGKARIYRAWYVTGYMLECDAKLRTEII